MKKSNGTTKPVTDSKTNLKMIESFLAILILAALAFRGVQSLVDAAEAVKTALGILVIVLLVKSATKH